MYKIHYEITTFKKQPKSHACIISQHMHAAYVSSDFVRCKIGENFFQDAIHWQVPRFQFGLDFLIVENSDNLTNLQQNDESSGEVAFHFNIDLQLLKVALIFCPKYRDVLITL